MLLCLRLNIYSTSLAIAGKDFCVVASDTRQSTGYNINSRYTPKAYILADNAVIAMNGFHADGLTLKKVLDQRLKVRRMLDKLGMSKKHNFDYIPCVQWYKFSHDKGMSCTALAQMLSITLYQKRFFPYYSFCCLGGVDEKGKDKRYTYVSTAFLKQGTGEGAVYCYDAIGSYERESYRANGSAAALIQPFLDNQVMIFCGKALGNFHLSNVSAIGWT